jgi:hypothetical protein
MSFTIGAGDREFSDASFLQQIRGRREKNLGLEGP